MPSYPRACPKCGVLTAEEGFAIDRNAAAGRKSHCKACDRQRRKAYYDAARTKWNAERKAAREALAENISTILRITALASPIAQGPGGASTNLPTGALDT